MSVLIVQNEAKGDEGLVATSEMFEVTFVAFHGDDMSGFVGSKFQ